MDLCPLCGLETPVIRDSHILSEFLYKYLYDSNHKFPVVTNDTTRYPQRPSKGFKELLLCPSCEQLLGCYETHAAEILYKDVTTYTVIENTVTVQGIDYTRFKLFLLSLLWRAGVSTNSIFAKVKLGPHLEKIRQMLLCSDPATTSKYGCMVYAVTWKGRLADQFIRSPRPCRFGNHRGYMLLARGFLYLYHISSHEPPIELAKRFLNESGTLFAPIEPIETSVFLRDVYRDLLLEERKQTDKPSSDHL